MGAYGNCGSDAYGDTAPRSLNLLTADYGDASQLTWYVGDDGLVHACAHNLLRSSANLQDGTGWFAAGTATIDSPRTVTLSAPSDRMNQLLFGGGTNYTATAGEALTVSCTLEVLRIDRAGDLIGLQHFDSTSGQRDADTQSITTAGQVLEFRSSSVVVSISGVQVQLARAVTDGFLGQVKVTNICLSVGSETFPYIKTGTAGARYSYRLPENLRRWNGTAYTTSKITELNTGVTVNALVEGVAVTNLVDYHNGDNTGDWIISDATWQASTETDPSGALGAGRIVEGTTNAQHQNRNFSMVSADGSFIHVGGYFKAQGSRDLRVHYSDKSGALTRLDVDLSDGSTLGTSGSPIDPIVRALGNGWYYAGFTVATVSGAFSESLRIYILSSGSPTYTGDGTSGIHTWGLGFAQVVWAPQPILTYGSSVTRTAEAPVTSDFAGASTTGKHSFKTSFVATHDGGSTPIISWNSETAGRYLRLLSRDQDLDGDAFAVMQNNPGTGSENTDLTQSLLTDRTHFVSGGWDVNTLAMSVASTDLSNSLADTIATSAFQADLGFDISLALQSGTTSPVVGFITALYIPNAFLTESQYAGQ